MKRIAMIFLILGFIALISSAALTQDGPGPIFLAQGPGAMGMGPMGPGHDMGMGPHHGPFGTWWKNSEVVKELQLTDAQVKQIEQTFLDYRLKLIDLRADVERQETKLQPLLEADQPNEHEVSSQVDLVVAARGKLEKTNTMMMLAIRRVLSVDQWKKLQAIERRRGPRDVFYRRTGPGDREQWIFRERRGDASEPPQPPAPPEAPAAPGDK
jgi:Spy/CpxP family protein refolding chaperone